MSWEQAVASVHLSGWENKPYENSGTWHMRKFKDPMVKGMLRYSTQSERQIIMSCTSHQKGGGTMPCSCLLVLEAAYSTLVNTSLMCLKGPAFEWDPKQKRTLQLLQTVVQAALLLGPHDLEDSIVFEDLWWEKMSCVVSVRQVPLGQSLCRS